jgi:hypothetical protein
LNSKLVTLSNGLLIKKKEKKSYDFIGKKNIWVGLVFLGRSRSGKQAYFLLWPYYKQNTRTDV